MGNVIRTPEMLARLKELWMSDLPTRDVQRSFPAAGDTIRLWARSLGLPPHRTWATNAEYCHPKSDGWPEARTERLRELWTDKGKRLSASAIASVLNDEYRDMQQLSASAVIGKANRLGIGEKFPGVYRRRTHKVERKPQRKQPSNPRLALMGTERMHAKTPLPRPENRIETKVALISGGCRFICGTDMTKDDYFCGAPLERGSYCAEHAKRMYQPTRPPDVQNALWWARR